MNKQTKESLKVDWNRVRDGFCIGFLVFVAAVVAIAIVSCEVSGPELPAAAKIDPSPPDGIIGDAARSDPFVEVPEINFDDEPSIEMFDPMPLSDDLLDGYIERREQIFCDDFGFLCDINASCNDTDRGYECMCDAGYYGDGTVFGSGCVVMPVDQRGCHGKKLGWSFGSGHDKNDIEHDNKHNCD